MSGERCSVSIRGAHVDCERPAAGEVDGRLYCHEHIGAMLSDRNVRTGAPEPFPPPPPWGDDPQDRPVWSAGWNTAWRYAWAMGWRPPASAAVDDDEHEAVTARVAIALAGRTEAALVSWAAVGRSTDRAQEHDRDHATGRAMADAARAVLADAGFRVKVARIVAKAWIEARELAHERARSPERAAFERAIGRKCPACGVPAFVTCVGRVGDHDTRDRVQTDVGILHRERLRDASQR